jgi:hypothetical protein
MPARAWHCWPLNKAVKHRAGIAPVRRVRRFRRVAAVAVSKPAIVGWICISTWWPVPVGQATAPPRPLPAIAADTSPTDWLAGQLAFAAPPDCCSPAPPPDIPAPPPVPPETPQTPQTPPVPEPGSLALLATGLAALAIIRGRTSR